MGTTTTSPRSDETRVPAVQVTLAMFDSRGAGLPGAPRGRADRAIHPARPGRLHAVGDDAAARCGRAVHRAPGPAPCPGRVTIGLLLDESGSMAANREAVIAGMNEFVGGMRDVDAVDPGRRARSWR